MKKIKRSKFPYTQKTLKLLRDSGYTVDITERVLGRTFIKKDLFGIIDLIAISDTQTIGVQTTSYAARRPHLVKILETERANTEKWLKAGRELWLICWKKKLVGKRNRYEPLIEKFTQLSCKE